METRHPFGMRLSLAVRFKALTDNNPFPWQEALFSEFLSGKFPEDISLPTGTGKTSIMALWLLALAEQASTDPWRISVPRRLIWVVNRRVVVDQATTEAERLRNRLNETGFPELESTRAGLRALCAVANDAPLGISTLRGQFADNSEWRNDPARPAVIIGTVDMIGSRLLFSGYNVGFKGRPLHAGFLGQDALLVHDEAHLEPAFQQLILAIRTEQRRCREFRPFRIMGLTATSRTDGERQFSITSADRCNEELSRRIQAKKGIAFYAIDDEKHLSDAAYEHALEYKSSDQAILIFLRSVKDVENVSNRLEKAKLQAQKLTGTLRGYERDALLKKDAIFARFLKSATVTPQPGTVYLLCTSAGEIGIDMSADHLICDLVPFDSMAQRFGRVNRFGNRDAVVEILHPSTFAGEEFRKKGDSALLFEKARESTLLLLQKLPKRADGRYECSPAALSDLPVDGRQSAFTPPPIVLSTSEILFDSWALTSIRGELPGRPPVVDWLHGLSESEPPETYIAWRDEVETITADLRETYEPADLMGDYPLKPHELLRDRSDRVFNHLAKIAARCPGAPVWLVDDGKVEVLTLSELVQKDNRDRINYRTVLLSPTVGGLRDGLLNGDSEIANDIADEWQDEGGNFRRRVWDDDTPPEEMRLVRVIDIAPDSEEESALDGAPPVRRYWYWYVRPKSADDDGSRSARQPQQLAPHLEAAGDLAAALVAKLVGEPEEARAVVLAAKWHDRGKSRSIWQRSIGNRDPNLLLAKSGGKAFAAEITSYRHEFGSVIDISRDSEFRGLSKEVRELVLHLVAAHHGRARPHFPADETFDPDYPEDVTDEVARQAPRRFARLQRKYGRWGLAFLESLVRAADALASQKARPAAMPQEFSCVATEALTQ